MNRAGPAAIVVPCASRKRVAPRTDARAISLVEGSQAALEVAWIRRLADLPQQMAAGQLYMGRGFALGANAARISGAPLYVISAGLGLVHAERQVPSYGMTVGADGIDAIRGRSVDAFNPRSWWSAVRTSAFSIDWADAFRGDGAVLIALTRAYAEMIVDDLLELPEAHRMRLRLFGLALPATVPNGLAPCVMPYDERLDQMLKGTRTDFAQRALSHFVANVPPGQDRDADREAVLRMLAQHVTPERIERPRLGDDEIVAAIAKHLRSVTGIGRILRKLRDDDGIACEQRRFTRLYHRAMAESV